MFILHVQFRANKGTGVYIWSGCKDTRLCTLLSDNRVRVLAQKVPCSTCEEFVKWIQSTQRCTVTSIKNLSHTVGSLVTV